MAAWFRRKIWYPLVGMSIEQGIAELDECIQGIETQMKQQNVTLERVLNLKRHSVHDKARFSIHYAHQRRLEKQIQMLHNNLGALNNLKTQLETAKTVETIQEVLQNVSPVLEKLKGSTGGPVDVQKLLANFQHTTTKFQMTVDSVQDQMGDSVDSDMVSQCDRDYRNHLQAYEEAHRSSSSCTSKSTPLSSELSSPVDGLQF